MIEDFRLKIGGNKNALIRKAVIPSPDGIPSHLAPHEGEGKYHPHHQMQQR